ncbi:MAG: hypothetical protein PHY46_05240 [Candidatus Omnitrophica bacterium]|nr:hypothetical protein [Candidatus Omnitrophota bacterium]
MEEFDRIKPLLQLAKDTLNEMVQEKEGVFSRLSFTKKVAAKIDMLEEKYTTEELLMVGEFCEYAFVVSDKKSENKESGWE